MRRTSWTPSIVPADDETVYLVADDFGKIGRAWREADYDATAALCPSVQPSAGLRTSLPTSRKNFVADAIYRCAICHPPFLISWNATKCHRRQLSLRLV